MTSDDFQAGDHRRTLGLCWIAYAILRLVMGIALILWNGTATVMFGALLNRVPNPFALMSDFHFVYLVLIALSFVCALLGLLAGLALLANQRSGRILAIVAAFLSVSEIPIGTTLGIFTLIVFFRPSDTTRSIHSS